MAVSWGQESDAGLQRTERSVTELRDLTATTVIVGRLNPLIFSPEWLQANNIIGPQEATEARENGIEVMAPNITSIALGSMKLVIEESRFVLSVSDEPLVRAKDFPVGCFRALSHTPAFAIGINLNGTLRGDNIDSWHRFGDMLAPKEPWGDFVASASGERLGGVRALVMERLGAPGGRRGHTRCAIQATENSNLEAALQINNHFDIGSQEKPSNGTEVYRLIEEFWDDLFVQSKEMLERVKGWADAA